MGNTVPRGYCLLDNHVACEQRVDHCLHAFANIILEHKTRTYFCQFIVIFVTYFRDHAFGIIVITKS